MGPPREEGVAALRSLTRSHERSAIESVTASRAISGAARLERRSDSSRRVADLTVSEPCAALLLLDGGLHLRGHLRGDGRHAVGLLGVLRAFGHDLRLVLAFRDEVAAGHQVAALEDLRHDVPPLSGIGGRVRLVSPRRHQRCAPAWYLGQPRPEPGLPKGYLTGATTRLAGEPLRKRSTFWTAASSPSRITSGVWPAL